MQDIFSNDQNAQGDAVFYEATRPSHENTEELSSASDRVVGMDGLPTADAATKRQLEQAIRDTGWLKVSEQYTRRYLSFSLEVEQ